MINLSEKQKSILVDVLNTNDGAIYFAKGEVDDEALNGLVALGLVTAEGSGEEIMVAVNEDRLEEIAEIFGE